MAWSNGDQILIMESDHCQWKIGQESLGVWPQDFGSEYGSGGKVRIAPANHEQNLNLKDICWGMTALGAIFADKFFWNEGSLREKLCFD